MNSTHKSEAIERIVRRAMLAASVVALALAMAGPSLAQTQASPGKPATAAAKAAAATQKPAAKSAPKGINTGVTVHGWWVIDVRNPDGKVVTHREFENSLVTGGAGDGFLAAVLGKTIQVGNWAAVLWDPTHATGFWLAQNSSDCTNNPPDAGEPGTLVACGTLAVQVVGSNSNSLALTGNMPVPTGFPSSIGSVESWNQDTGNYEFTQATISPAIPVTVGQVVNVAVTFSFSSQ